MITLALQLLNIKLTTFISSGSHELNNNIFIKDTGHLFHSIQKQLSQKIYLNACQNNPLRNSFKKEYC